MALHTYVRWKLNEKYGDAVQAKTGPIRADLLGNMWAQEWGNIYPLVAPAGSGDLGYDIGDLLKAKGKTPLDMVRAGENFYSSLGFAPLPETFWKRSLLDRKSVVSGKSVSVRVDLGGRRIIYKKKQTNNVTYILQIAY